MLKHDMISYVPSMKGLGVRTTALFSQIVTNVLEVAKDCSYFI